MKNYGIISRPVRPVLFIKHILQTQNRRENCGFVFVKSNIVFSYSASVR